MTTANPWGPRANRPAQAGGLLFLAVVVIAVQFLFAPNAFAQDTEIDCSGVFAGYGACAGVDDDTPTPPPPDTSEADREAARVQATAQLKQKLVSPGWRTWPNHADKQVVELQTFFHITDTWESESVTVTVNDQTVTVTATPVRSIWTLTETGFGSVTVVPCDGPGIPWSEGLTSTDCGWTPEHSTSVAGPVELTPEVEFTISTPGEPSTAFRTEGESRTLCVAEVLTYGISPVSSSRSASTTCGGSHPDDNPDGSVPRGDADPADGLPIKTLTCTAWGQGEATFLGVQGDAGAGFDFIVEEFADGTKIVTVAGDVGAGVGTGLGPTGAAIQINDLTVGAYFDAGISVLATVGGGAEYHLPADKELNTFLGELLIGTVTDPVADIGNLLVPGDPIPTGPDPSAGFVDVTVKVEAGATAVAGIGVISAGASAGASAEVTHVVKHNDDGTWANIVIYSGEVSAEVSAGSGLPFFDWSEDRIGVYAEAAISIETIYADDGTELETIVTVSYGTDADNQSSLSGEDDALSITTQQWSYDLTDPEVAEAVGTLDTWARLSPAEILARGALPPDLDGLREFGETTGPITQQVTDHNFFIGAEGGIGILAGDVSLDVSCRVLA